MPWDVLGFEHKIKTMCFLHLIQSRRWSSCTQSLPSPRARIPCRRWDTRMARRLPSRSGPRTRRTRQGRSNQCRLGQTPQSQIGGREDQLCVAKTCCYSLTRTTSEQKKIWAYKNIQLIVWSCHVTCSTRKSTMLTSCCPASSFENNTKSIEQKICTTVFLWDQIVWALLTPILFVFP